MAAPSARSSAASRFMMGYGLELRSALMSFDPSYSGTNTKASNLSPRISRINSDKKCGLQTRHWYFGGWYSVSVDLNELYLKKILSCAHVQTTDPLTTNLHSFSLIRMSAH